MTLWADALACNFNCECWPIESGEIVAALPEAVGSLLDERHANLFAETGVFLSASDLQSMTGQISAIEKAAQQPGYLARVLDDSPDCEQQRATRGLLMGYDFHLSADGPKLIEINTNAGGAFLTQHMMETLKLASPFATEAEGEAEAGALLVEMFVSEWRLAGRSGLPGTIVIVDASPESEYLYSDMSLAASVLRQHFDRVVVADVDALNFEHGRLWVCSESSGRPEAVDLVYNRLTDFALSQRSTRALRMSWLADAAVVSPSPRHHSLLANKLNLQVLGDRDLIQALDLDPADKAALTQIPETVELTPENADNLWRQRKQLFFKPAAGYAGRMAYRGAKLTRKRFQVLLEELQQTPYVAQTLVQPAKRMLVSRGQSGASGLAEREGAQRLKFDVRVYSYAAQPLLLAARVYEGQTTNFRTPGGGFAPAVVMQDVMQDAEQSSACLVHCSR